MRTARVLGTVTLSTRLPEVPPGQLLLAQPQSTPALRGEAPATADLLVTYDELGATFGSLVGIADGREATQPFLPRRVPFDLYCAAILDVVHVEER